jgi:nitroimidazol reductase NimA-like FMN-containing flavoprotein (pyridoxamine 5'-phosphate oxidase superfamily)
MNPRARTEPAGRAATLQDAPRPREDLVNEPFDLTPTECRELLAAGLVGRVATCTPVGPHIVPVNYGIVDDAVVIRTTPYSVLGSHARGAVLALEVDQFDYERQRGWSVVARGRAVAVTAADELAHIKKVWDPNAWAGGPRNVYLRIHWTELSGRRLGLGWDPRGDLPVRRVV